MAHVETSEECPGKPRAWRRKNSIWVCSQCRQAWASVKVGYADGYAWRWRKWPGTDD